MSFTCSEFLLRSLGALSAKLDEAFGSKMDKKFKKLPTSPCKYHLRAEPMSRPILQKKRGSKTKSKRLLLRVPDFCNLMYVAFLETRFAHYSNRGFK